MAKIYVSSTYADLAVYRKSVNDVLFQLGQQVIAMEHYVASDERPLARCRADVESSDVYVGILAWRYGFVPPGSERSITELEYQAAIDKGIPVLFFLAADEAAWPRNQMDRPSTQIEVLRDRVKSDHMVSFFETPEDLATKVAIAVSRELRGLGEAPPTAVTIRVFNFDNHSDGARQAMVGERFPGVVLDQLLKRQLTTRATDDRLLPSRVFMFRGSPPADLTAELRRMAPCILVSGFVEQGEARAFRASIRVASFNSDLQSAPLIVEEAEFDDSHASMVAAWSDVADRIWVEAKKLDVQIDRLVGRLD